VFVWERPVFRLRIRAPADRAVRIPRPGVGPYSLRTDLYDSEGNRNPNLTPPGVPPGAVLPPEWMVTIPAGKTFETRLHAAQAPLRPGRNRLHIAGALEWPAERGVEKHLFVDAVALDDKTVVARLSIPGKNEPSGIEIVTARLGDRLVLVHVNKNHQTAGRIGAIETGTDVALQEASPPQGGPFDGHIVLRLEDKQFVRLRTTGYPYPSTADFSELLDAAPKRSMRGQ
jgi:hypothetical protein